MPEDGFMNALARAGECPALLVLHRALIVEDTLYQQLHFSTGLAERLL
jgi:hypothetical protein